MVAPFQGTRGIIEIALARASVCPAVACGGKDRNVPSNGYMTFRTHVDWPELLNRVQQNKPGAGEELYSLISEGWLFFLRRRMPAYIAEDALHDAFVIVLKAIRDGRIENPKAFPGYVMTVTKRQYFLHLQGRVDAAVCSDEFADRLPSKSKDPDSILEAQRRSTLIAEVLLSMSPPRREILNRFYILEQSEEHICIEMNLTTTQHRLLKSRAKTEFGERGREKLTPRKAFYAKSLQ